MWPTFKSSKINKDQTESKEHQKSLNVNEEYFSALRTKSNVDFFTKAHFLVNEQSTPSYCYHQFSLLLLEPEQESIAPILESAIFSQKPDLKHLMLKYFDISAEASKFCSHLLRKISQIQTSYKFVQRAFETIDHFSTDRFELVLSDLSSSIVLQNPFSDPSKHDIFEMIRSEYSSVLHHLNSKKRKVARKIKLIKYFKKATGICITAGCSLVAIAAMVLALHTFTALLMGPAIFSLPFKRLKKFFNGQFLRSGILRKVGEQLDVAAKGTYILNRDFDTMSRLVARVHDEIEHNKAMIQLCLEKGKVKDRFFLEEVVKELKKSDVGFRKQVDELEEHVCLCLVTINRARALVLREMTSCCA